MDRLTLIEMWLKKGRIVDREELLDIRGDSRTEVPGGIYSKQGCFGWPILRLVACMRAPLLVGGQDRNLLDH